MNILALDTSSRYFCLAIGKDDKLLAQVYKPFERELSRLIIPAIEKALKKAGLDLSDIDCFGSGLGPGSFTGLRVGLSTVKGFTFVLNKPLVGIASLDIIASGCGIEGFVCPIVDARRSLVYSALYSFKNSRLKRSSRYFLCGIKDLLSRIKGRVNFIGDGILLYRREIEVNLKERAHFLEADLWYPQPENILKLTFEKMKNKEFVDSDRVVPLYLYPKDCQVRKAKNTK